jgi:hypothetical protein
VERKTQKSVSNHRSVTPPAGSRCSLWQESHRHSRAGFSGAFRWSAWSSLAAHSSPHRHPVAAASLRCEITARQPLPLPASGQTRLQTLPVGSISRQRLLLHLLAGRARSLRRGGGVWRHSSASRFIKGVATPTPSLRRIFWVFCSEVLRRNQCNQ